MPPFDASARSGVEAASKVGAWWLVRPGLATDLRPFGSRYANLTSIRAAPWCATSATLTVQNAVSAGSARGPRCREARQDRVAVRPSPSHLPCASGACLFSCAGMWNPKGGLIQKRPACGHARTGLPGAAGAGRCAGHGGACGRRTRLTIPGRFMGPCAACDKIILQIIMFLSRRRLAKCSIMNAAALPA